MAVSFSFSDEEQHILADVVLNAIDGRLKNEPMSPPDLSKYPPKLVRNLGCFVTLNIHGRLRGCIGTIVAREPLVLNAWRMAQAAAFKDPRFKPLTAAEWPDTSVEITLLDALSVCPDISKIEIGRHGLVLQARGHSGVFLPQVPVEQGWNLGQYLTHLCAKAGLPDRSWEAPDARLFWYEGFKFTARA